MTDADRPRVLMVRPAGDGKWGVVTIERRGTDYRTEPCPRCPWRVDAPLNAFPPQVFRDSARTTYDLATHTFGCHGSSRSAPQICAGFLLRGASDNLAIRMAVVDGRIDPDSIGSSWSSTRTTARWPSPTVSTRATPHWRRAAVTDP